MPIPNRELSQFASFLYVDNSSKNISITTTTSYNVGIGSLLPAQKLDVLGNVKVSGNINASGIITANTFVGSVSGISSSATKLLVDSTSVNSNYYFTLIDNASVGTYSTIYTDSGLSYNPNADLLSASKLIVSGISTFAGISSFTGNVTVGIATTNTITFNSRVNSDFLPSTDNSVSLGSSLNKWDKIYANEYKNFTLNNLPTSQSIEPTFGADRILKVNSSATGYEFIDVLDLSAYTFGSFKISKDGNVYTGIGSTVSNRLQISGISTSKLYVGEKVKVFGATPFSDNTLVDPPVTASSSAVKVGVSATVSTYRYWIAQYHLQNGKVGVSSQISPLTGIGMTTLDNFNNVDHIALTLARTDTNHGILVYRQVGITTNINQANLVAILGPKELGSDTSNILWRDYGTYEQTEWSSKGTSNEYNENQIHFPNIATTGYRRGWAIDSIISVGTSSITLNGQYKTNIGIGTTSQVKVVHDNTYALANAIQSAIDSGEKSLDLPSGTYLANKIIIPSGFTLRGNGKNTILKQQYFATDASDGGGNSLTLDGNFVGIGTTNPSDVTIQDLTIDGNSGNNILFNGDIDNYLVYLENVSSSLIKSVEVRNTPAHGVYIYNSRRLSIENSSFVDGCITDRYDFQPLNAQQSQSLRLNDCLFENYPGPVDLSVTTVVSTGGNIIRNCGTGLRIYAASKIITNNNLILGPADEWIPTPDIYDSDYNSINLSIQRGVNFVGPVLQYLENGSPKDISSGRVSIVSAGIGTIVNEGAVNESLGTRFLNFNVTTPDTGTFGRQNGYIQLSMNAAQTSTLGITSSLGYDIIAKEYLANPVGFTTSVAIGSGTWNTIGAGATQYTVTLNDYTQFSGISTGDVVKLVNHAVSPDLSSFELTVSQKIDAGAVTKQLVLTGFTTTSITNGGQTGYISIRNLFTIAKGRIGVL